MENKIYAVIDTNVIVLALISKSLELNPVKIVRVSSRNELFRCSTTRLSRNIAMFCQGPSIT